MRQSLIRLRHKAKRYFRWLWPWIIRGRAFLRWLPVQTIPVSSKYFGRPKGLYRTTHEYLASPTGRSGGQRSHEIYPAETLRFTLPTPLDGEEVHWKFREHQVKEMPASYVFELENARFWGHYAGSIITPDDRLLADLSHDVLTAENHKIFTKFKLPACRRIEGTVAVLATAEAATNYWHWTFDLLPRFHLLEKAGFTPANVDFYLVNHTGLAFQLETLAELGIRPEQIIRVDDSCHFEVERIVVSSLKPSQLHVAPWVCEYLRHFIPAPPSAEPPSRRLFISRENATFRRLLNEAEVFEALRPLGFEKIHSEHLTVGEQRRIFRQAACVVAPHGAALSNLVYCQAGTDVVELFPASYVDLSMWPHSSHRRLNHRYLIGEGAVADSEIRRTSNLSLSQSQIQKLVLTVTNLDRAHSEAQC